MENDDQTRARNGNAESSVEDSSPELKPTLEQVRQLEEQLRSFRQLLEQVRERLEPLRQLQGRLEPLRQIAKALEAWERESPEGLKQAFGHAGYLASGRVAMSDLRRVIMAFKAEGQEAALRAIEAIYDEYFHNSAFLDEIEHDWSTCSLLQKRWPVLSDALKAHRLGLYSASIPPLIAQAEGIVVDWMGHKGLLYGPQYQQLLGKLSARGQAPWATWTEPLLLEFVSSWLLRTFCHGGQIPPFSRHAILHGGDFQYGTEVNSRKAILLVDHLWSLISPA